MTDSATAIRPLGIIRPACLTFALLLGALGAGPLAAHPNPTTKIPPPVVVSLAPDSRTDLSGADQLLLLNVDCDAAVASGRAEVTLQPADANDRDSLPSAENPGEPIVIDRWEAYFWIPLTTPERETLQHSAGRWHVYSPLSYTRLKETLPVSDRVEFAATSAPLDYLVSVRIELAFENGMHYAGSDLLPVRFVPPAGGDGWRVIVPEPVAESVDHDAAHNGGPPTVALPEIAIEPTLLDGGPNDTAPRRVRLFPSPTRVGEPIPNVPAADAAERATRKHGSSDGAVPAE